MDADAPGGGHSGQFISRGLLVVAEMPGGHAFIRGGEPLSQYAEFAHACKKWNKAENKLRNKFAVLNRTTFPPVQNVLVCFFPYGIASAAGGSGQAACRVPERLLGGLLSLFPVLLLQDGSFYFNVGRDGGPRARQAPQACPAAGGTNGG